MRPGCPPPPPQAGPGHRTLGSNPFLGNHEPQSHRAGSEAPSHPASPSGFVSRFHAGSWPLKGATTHSLSAWRTAGVAVPDGSAGTAESPQEGPRP